MRVSFARDAAAIDGDLDMKLQPRLLEKPWGRIELPAPFEGIGCGRPIGEVHFTQGDAARQPLPLLVKYIFTDAPLSVQVHPNDGQARARGFAGGKSECWYILAAEPGASLALGFRRDLGLETLRRAALDGSIAELMNWHPVRGGDFFYVPAGTVHTIGGGICLIEIQQKSDVTYRLYDFDRARRVDLEEGLAVAERRLHAQTLMTHVAGGESRTLVAGPHFQVDYVVGDGPVGAMAGTSRWVLPLRGGAAGADAVAAPGECLYVPAGAALSGFGDAALLVTSAGGSPGASASFGSNSI
jgi:mannose-6-phosphate isomerase